MATLVRFSVPLGIAMEGPFRGWPDGFQRSPLYYQLSDMLGKAFYDEPSPQVVMIVSSHRVNPWWKPDLRHEKWSGKPTGSGDPRLPNTPGGDLPLVYLVLWREAMFYISSTSCDIFPFPGHSPPEPTTINVHLSTYIYRPTGEEEE